jgi:large subunit ribosomal protein L4
VAISARASEQRLRIVKDFSLSEAKTKNVAAAIKALSADGTDSALIVDGDNDALKRGAKNLAKARYLNDAGINVQDVLGHRTLIITESAAKRIADRLTGEGEE